MGLHHAARTCEGGERWTLLLRRGVRVGRRRGAAVSPTTACKWWRRWPEASATQRRSLACLEDRSSRPHRCPALLAIVEQRADLRGYAAFGLRPRLIAGETGHAHATVWRPLRRAGISRRPKPPFGDRYRTAKEKRAEVGYE